VARTLQFRVSRFQCPPEPPPHMALSLSVSLLLSLSLSLSRSAGDRTDPDITRDLQSKKNFTCPNPEPYTPNPAQHGEGRWQRADYPQVAIPGSWYKFVNFGAKKSPGSPSRLNLKPPQLNCGSVHGAILLLHDLRGMLPSLNPQP
jgi:hypothetical protein